MKRSSSVLFTLALALAACDKKAPAPAPAPTPAKPNPPTPGKPTPAPVATADSGSGTAAPTASADAGSAAPTPAATGLRAVKIAVGRAACAVMSNGTVRCWGPANYGETGQGKSETVSAVPMQVPGITDATDIAIGGDPGDQGDLVCVTRKDNKVSCWGYKRLSPVADAETDKGPVEMASIAEAKSIQLLGGRGTFAAADGKVKAWGNASFNALNLGAGDYNDHPLLDVAGVTDAVQSVSGQNHMCALLKDGGAMCWGYSGPKQEPKKVEGVANGVSIATGYTETCVLTKEKKVLCWGEDQKPAEVAEFSGASAISGGAALCAVVNGKVWCKGYNKYGMLGNPEAPNYGSKPYEMKLEGTAVAVAAGASASCALMDSGKVFCTGRNLFGVIGDGTLMDRKTPVEVVGLTDETLPPANDGSAQAQESDVAMDWTGMPDKCSHDAITVNYPRFTGNSFEPVSAYATSEFDGKTVWVYLANYKLDPTNPGEARRGHQFALSMHFFHVDLRKNNEAKPVDKGIYTMSSDKQERWVASTAGSAFRSEMLATITLEGVKGGSAAIQYLDENWVCGTLALTGGEGVNFTGPFAARIRK